ncbi:MAG: carboxymuconolactone decarboxylase family protein [Actinobacteria bacterium]|nr:carboxymuconolactone decarboxylase family protein [Actinomycetota bacterium]
MAEYENRQRWDLDAWPEMYGTLKELQALVFLSPPGIEMNMMVFTISSLSSGCRHCQAHGAYGLNSIGMEIGKIEAIWSFEHSDLFDARERAALSFAIAAGSTPSSVTPDHHADLRTHFTDEEARTLLAVVAVGGFMNRYNDALATVTDSESANWAKDNLSPLGWDLGKHTGAQHEQRTGPPGSG